MNSDYEKHQRDYTVLAFAEIVEELFSKRIKKFFPHRTHKIYMLLEDEIFYHFVSEKDCIGWPASWAEKYSYADLYKYGKKIDKQLATHNKFLKQKHKNTVKDILRLHEYMRIFIPIVFLSFYLPEYYKNVDKKIINLCFKFRKKYEDIHKVGMTLQKRLLNSLENELKIKNDSLEYLLPEEFKEFLKSKRLPKNLDKRKDFMFVEYSSGGIKIIPKKNALAKIKEIDITAEKKMFGKEIKGNVAFAGITKGRVKIIRLIEDAKDLKSGDVLVASMTDPRYVPAMKRATAIVTDEGGITCHAAIVARELKIPCIVGTKFATKFLKDGDEVEVDADKGIIKII